MPSLEYFIVGESVSIDQMTNRVSIFHVLEEIHASTFPVVIPQLTAVAHWNMLDGEIGNDYQVQIVAFADDESPTIFSQNFKATHPRQRTMLVFVGLKIQKEGRHRIELKLDGKHQAFHEIDAKPNLTAHLSASGPY